MRWGMLAVVVIAAGWMLYEVFRRFALVESFDSLARVTNKPD
jgi:hypothetical protein